MRELLTTDAFVIGIRSGQRDTLARAITLIESSLPEHQKQAQSILQALLPDTGKAIRLGISGVPGVGKSTFIESLGIQLIEQGHRIAVLAIDPSSQRSGGSILGDKTRMPVLSAHDHAFVRPSPTSGYLGGVTRVTRESLLLCEAAGYDVILVETVGVGQSETLVADMVDCYLVLMLPGAGDELQGIKKGVLELADIIAVNKADGEMLSGARLAKAAYARALSIIQPVGSWTPLALTCSSLTGDGLDTIWQTVLQHRQQLQGSNELVLKREQQQIKWLWRMVEQQVLGSLRARSGDELIERVEAAVRAGDTTVPQGCEQLLKGWRVSIQTNK
jgi:LAO/AO transport system kinase